MPNIHELLDDAQKNCQSLFEEMKAFKSASTLNEKAAAASDSVRLALEKTAKALEPFKQARMRKLETILIWTTGINFVMFLTLLLEAFLKK